MSRNTWASNAQLEMLIEYLESHPWVATGFSRSVHARDRTRVAWETIAERLNSLGTGSIKTPQQWAKFWRDKKTSVKKKISQNRIMRQQTGGGAETEFLELTDNDRRIVGLCGGESFATGDTELSLNPFYQPEQGYSELAEQGQSPHSPPFPIIPTLVLPDAEIQEVNFLNNTLETDTHTTLSESLLQDFATSLQVERGTAPVSSMTIEPQVAPRQPIQPVSNATRPAESSPTTHRRHVVTSHPYSRASTHTNSTPRPRSTATRRPVHRSPPAQRRSQLASLTERFIAIEERRADSNRILGEGLRSIGEGLKALAEALIMQNQALRDMAERTTN